MAAPKSIGFVIIGRNEGERLRRCFKSIPGGWGPIVYVDSGSTDGSTELAASVGAIVLDLDTSIKFTAARARNAGFRKLQEIAPTIEFVQFVDGDCQVADGWPETAGRWLAEHEGYALVSGSRREMFPERTVYNYLCNLEWQTPVGDALACGGDAMVRVAALAAVGGYRDSLIAGEEPELCFRLRAAGWRIRRLDAEMGLHDAAITRFGQWWKRSRRGGYAYASGAYLHGRSPEAYCVRDCLRILFWGAGIPIAVVLGWFLIGPAALGLLLAYPANVLRIRYLLSGRDRGWRWSIFLVLIKFPEAIGLFQFWADRLRGRDGLLIEYK